VQTYLAAKDMMVMMMEDSFKQKSYGHAHKCTHVHNKLAIYKRPLHWKQSSHKTCSQPQRRIGFHAWMLFPLCTRLDIPRCLFAPLERKLIQRNTDNSLSRTASFVRLAVGVTTQTHKSAQPCIHPRTSCSECAHCLSNTVRVLW